MYKPSKKIKAFIERIEAMRTKDGIKAGEISGTFSVSDIRSMRRLLNSYGKIKEEERQALFDALITAVFPRFFDNTRDGKSWYHTKSQLGVDEEQTQKGLEWFRKNLKRWEREAKGKFRLDSKFCSFVGGVQDVITLDMFKEFRFGGFQKTAEDNIVTSRYGLFNVVPIWQVILKDGSSFAYSYGSWQSNSHIDYNPSFQAED